MNNSQPVSVSDTPDLHALLESFGAQPQSDAYGTSASFGAISSAQVGAGFAAPLPDFGLIEVSGDDAASFLHSQLTNDVGQLGEAQARWYGYCSPKGRLLGTFIGWRDPDARIWLATAAPQLEALRKRLSMFVLRAKAKLQDRSGTTALIGVGGSAAPSAIEALGMVPPDPMTVAHAEGISCIGLPAVEIDGAPCQRWLIAATLDSVQGVWTSLREHLCAASSEIWRWTEVLSAVPRIVPATAERFVPQMLNFEVVGGVNFRKGCYPGQEVVARSQYLGKLKRRMFIGHLEGAAPEPGTDVLAAGGDEPCGQVVLAARSPEGGVDLLFESQTAALEAGLVTVSGMAIELRALPYQIPA